MKKAVLAVMAFAASQAAAQTSAPPPAPAPAEGKSPQTRPLNLKLDQPARLFVQETAPERKDADNLPTLGGGSLNFERQRDLRPDPSSRATPYPTDSENSNRK